MGSGLLMQGRVLHLALAVTRDPLRQRGASDTSLGGYMGDGATGLDTHHEPVAVPRRQHSVTVGHGSGDFYCQNDDSAPLILTAHPDSSSPAALTHDYNLMTHNNWGCQDET